MSQTGIGTSLEQLQSLQNAIQTRAHAVTTATQDQLGERLQYLLLSLADASAQIAGGQGSIPSAAWQSFLDTARRQQYTYDTQVQRLGGGGDGGASDDLLTRAQRVLGGQAGPWYTHPVAIVGGIAFLGLAYYLYKEGNR
jgi:hypothetical protein